MKTEEIIKQAIELTKEDFTGKENIEFEEWGLGGKGRWKAIDKVTKTVIGIGHTKEEALYDSNPDYFLNKILEQKKGSN